MGYTEEQFWHMTMRSYNAHVKGHNLRQKMIDREMWRMGMYVRSAVADAIGATFGSKKGQKHKSIYPEQPFLENETFEDYTEQDVEVLRQRYIDNLKKQKQIYDERHS